MNPYPSYHLSPMNGRNLYAIDFQQGDVNGDSVPDHIYLTGEKPYGLQSPFVTNITLLIQDGRTNMFYPIVPQDNAGYNPTIFLGDFTGNGISEILLSIDSGGSGGYAFYYIYSFINNMPTTIFDHTKFDEEYTYKVNYLDHYQVEVKGNDSKRYIIDIKYKGKEYLSEIYDADGRLKEPIEGWVNPLGGLYPVDFQRNGIYGLYATQSIAGRYNADGLGYVQTSLEWNGVRFAPFFQTVGIFG
ncbi:hypothetical protein SAMN05660297_01080 [Natronincola peptidivorans]|uniref:Repeat domain-containing protein n=1 Tax=Natronincola peptidivorans TaxID=426128 RepID=A0A1I0AU58_9FIRM|nr:spore coat protein [Natronincola peptidivorans]SES97891.1 hypothetical protein SAMN05660297_01080 [Natronincola peptidivorans]